MSETETIPAAGKPSCDPSKETQTVMKDKSDSQKHIAANRGPSYKNKSISRPPTSNHLSQFSESSRTKHKANSHKLGVVNPQAQVIKGYKKSFLIFTPGYQARPLPRHRPGVGGGAPRHRHREPGGRRGGARPLIGQEAEYRILIG